MGKLDGKVALITGAGNGLGRAAALLFAAEGAKLVVAEIAEEAGAQTAREIQDEGGTALFVPTDVMEAASLEACVKRAASRFGRLDVLYNNAGGSSPIDGPVGATPVTAFERVIALNLTSTWLACHYALPLMIDAGGGAIVNTSSSSAMRMHSGSRHAYATAKGAVISLTKSIAFDYAKHKIRANCIIPGFTESERVAAHIASVPALFERYKAFRPLGAGQPTNVAHLALYLASDASAFTTGQMFHVNNEVMG